MVQLRHLLLLSSSLTWVIAFARAAADVQGQVNVQPPPRRRYRSLAAGAKRPTNRRRQLQASSNSTQQQLTVNDVCGDTGLSALEAYSTSAFVEFFGNITVEITTQSGGFNCGCMYEERDNNNNNNNDNNPDDASTTTTTNSLLVMCSLVYNSGENASIVSTNREFFRLVSSLALQPDDGEPEEEDDEDETDNTTETTTTTTVERFIPRRSGWADATGLSSWSETFDFSVEAALENDVLQFESCTVDNEYCNLGGSECEVCDENNFTTVAVSSACNDFETQCEANYQGSYMNEYFFDNKIVSILADEPFECDSENGDDSAPTRNKFCANLGDMETTLYDAFTAYANNTPPDEEFSCRCTSDDDGDDENNNDEDEDENENDPESASSSSVANGFTVTCGTTWTRPDPDDADEQIVFTYTESMEFKLRGAYLVPERMSWCNTPRNVQVPICTDYQFCLGQESLCSCSRAGCNTDYCELCSDGASVGYKCPSEAEPVLCSANMVGAFSFAFRSLQVAPDCTSSGAVAIPSISPTIIGIPTTTPLVDVEETLSPTAIGQSNGTSLPTPATNGTSSIITSDSPSESPVAAETSQAPAVSSTTPSPTVTSDEEGNPPSDAAAPTTVPTSGSSAVRDGMLVTAVMLYLGVTLAML